MRLPLLATTLFAYTTAVSSAITYTLARAANPTPDEQDAYDRIDAAIRLALARYARGAPHLSKTLNVQYVPGVPTADANYNGSVRFGSNRSYMNERTALHEISHTLGVGQTQAFDDRCAGSNWPRGNGLVREWDGAGARINCGGGHIWPYGLNYENEWSATNADRHVLLIGAMVADGM